MEKLVFFQPNKAVAISGGAAFRTRFAFAIDSYACSIIDTSGNGNLQLDILLLHPTPAATVTILLDHTPIASADRAGRLHLENAVRLQNLSSPAALGTRLWLRSRLRAGSLTTIARLSTNKPNGLFDPFGGFFERQRDVCPNVGTASSPASASAKDISEQAIAKNFGESRHDVVSISELRSSAFHTRVPKSIVTRAFFRITQYFIRFGRFFELGVCFFIVWIRVGNGTESPICDRP